MVNGRRPIIFPLRRPAATLHPLGTLGFPVLLPGPTARVLATPQVRVPAQWQIHHCVLKTRAEERA